MSEQTHYGDKLPNTMIDRRLLLPIHSQKTQEERDQFAGGLRAHPQLHILAPFYLRGHNRERLEEAEILDLENKLLTLSEMPTMGDFVTSIKRDTLVVTAMAGAGTRWVESIHKSENQSLVAERGIDPTAPRCFAPVMSDLGTSQKYMPIGIHNVRAVNQLGEHIVVYGGTTDAIAAQNEQKLVEEILRPAGIDATTFRQKIYPGKTKPAGHGDLLLQFFNDPLMQHLIRDKKYVLTNFGADANSFRTAVLSLLTMAVFDKYDVPLALFLPTTKQEIYSLYTDDNGLPIDSYHPKDDLKKPDGTPSGQTNVGMRTYGAAQLVDIMAEYAPFQALMQGGDTTVDYPGNELKQDHFDRACMLQRGRVALIAPFSKEQEIAHTPKGIEDLVVFESDMRNISEQDSAFRNRHGLL